MIIEFGVAKAGRFDSPESNETTEIIERPSGGQSVVYCSGKHSGRKCKMISSVIANKVLEKTAESFRDSAAVRSVSDQICREHAGNVCGDFCMFSADFESETVVVSRMTNLPVYYYQRGSVNVWDSRVQLLGSDTGIHPSITEIPIESGSVVIMLSEGILNAGRSSGEKADITELILSAIEDNEELSADRIADFFLECAVRMDENEPKDDMTVIVIKISTNSTAPARKMLVTCPVPRYESIFD